MTTWMKVVHDHPDLAHRKGQRIRRKNGAVVYEITGTMHVDESYREHYNFVHNYPILRRISGGSKSRPPGSQTYTTEFGLYHDFVTLPQTDHGDVG